ncbi:MAG: hypothetical protein AAGB04_08675 [Pseudomonadota bacterium]
MSTGYRAQRLNWVGGLAIASVLFQVFVSGWHGQLMAMSLKFAVSPTSPVIVICSPRGLLRIILDRDGNPVELPGQQAPAAVCIVCLALNNTEQAIAPRIADIQASRAAAIVYSFTRDAPLDRTPFVRCGLDPPISV